MQLVKVGVGSAHKFADFSAVPSPITSDRHSTCTFQREGQLYSEYFASPQIPLVSAIPCGGDVHLPNYCRKAAHRTFCGATRADHVALQRQAAFHCSFGTLRKCHFLLERQCFVGSSGSDSLISNRIDKFSPDNHEVFKSQIKRNPAYRIFLVGAAVRYWAGDLKNVIF